MSCSRFNPTAVGAGATPPAPPNHDGVASRSGRGTVLDHRRTDISLITKRRTDARLALGPRRYASRLRQYGC
jgi:hypothetical protein